jgi:hypothetical protein
MADLTLTCPHCGFSRTIPAENVPDHPTRVICPKCRERFAYRKPAAIPFPPEAENPLSAPVVSPSEAETPEPGPLTPGRLRSIDQLFKDAWQIYVRRVGVLMGLYLLAILFLLLPVGVFALLGAAVSAVLPDLSIPLLGAGILTGLLLGAITLFWGLAAMVYAVADEDLDIRTALQRGWSRIWAFAWVFSLAGFIVTGGFLLLIIPGVIFSVWFFLSQFVLAAEDERGMRALLKSKAYMQGRFFEVFLRLFVVWVVSAVIGMVPVLGAVLSLLFVPFMLIYGWLIFDDLRPKSGSLSFTCTSGEKATWLGIGALGFLIVPLSLLLLGIGWLGLSLSGLNFPWRWFGY